MLAISTTFHGPTNHRGARITASVMERKRDGQPVRRLTVECEDGLGIAGNHTRAAIALIQQLGWTTAQGYGTWIIGATDDGYVFVCDNNITDERFRV